MVARGMRTPPLVEMEVSESEHPHSLSEFRSDSVLIVLFLSSSLSLKSAPLPEIFNF